MGWLAPAHAG